MNKFGNLKYYDYLHLARPHQWSKNLIVFAPLLFSQQWSGKSTITLVFVFTIFSLLSSSIYAFNDVLDKELDLQHPEKLNRPIASGRISQLAGFIFAITACSLAILSSIAINQTLTSFAILYTIIAGCYTLWTKHILFLDVATIAALLLVRLLAGAAVVGVVPSPWIITATFSLGLMLASGKRLAEFSKNTTSIGFTRPVLKKYNLKMLQRLVSTFATSSACIYTVWCYDFYQEKSPESPIVLLSTIPVFYAIYRYSSQLKRGNLNEDPIIAAINDRGILACLAAFIIFHILMLYTGHAIKFGSQ